MGTMIVDVNLDPSGREAVDIAITGSSDIVDITLCVGYTISYELLLSVMVGKISLTGVPAGVIKSCLTTLAV